MVMHKNHEGEAVFEMLNKALELARREERVTEERSIKILIAQVHVVKVITLRKIIIWLHCVQRHKLMIIIPKLYVQTKWGIVHN